MSTLWSGLNRLFIKFIVRFVPFPKKNYESVIITRKETIHIDKLDNIFAGQMDELKGAYKKLMWKVMN